MSVTFKAPRAAACAVHDCTRIAADWSAGVAAEPIGRLLAEQGSGCWNWARCETTEIARAAVRILLVAGYTAGRWDEPSDGVLVCVCRLSKTSCRVAGA